MHLGTGLVLVHQRSLLVVAHCRVLLERCVREHHSSVPDHLFGVQIVENNRHDNVYWNRNTDVIFSIVARSRCGVVYECKLTTDGDELG